MFFVITICLFIWSHWLIDKCCEAMTSAWIKDKMMLAMLAYMLDLHMCRLSSRRSDGSNGLASNRPLSDPGHGNSLAHAQQYYQTLPRVPSWDTKYWSSRSTCRALHVPGGSSTCWSRYVPLLDLVGTCNCNVFFSSCVSPGKILVLGAFQFLFS